MTGGHAAAITPDGHYVAFITREVLVPGDTNASLDVYLRDRVANTIERVSLRADGSQIATGVAGSGLAISDDGRYVAFVASGTGVTPQDTFAGPDVFVRDRVLSSTIMMSVDSIAAGQRQTISVWTRR